MIEGWQDRCDRVFFGWDGGCSVETGGRWTGSPNKSIDQIGRNCLKRVRNLCLQVLRTIFGYFSDIFSTFLRHFVDIPSFWAVQRFARYNPKGPNLEKNQSRLEFSISLENFNPGLQNSPEKLGVWWAARLKFSLSPENFARSRNFHNPWCDQLSASLALYLLLRAASRTDPIHESRQDLEMFSIFGPLGNPEGPTINKIQSRSKFSISIDIFNLAREFQSRHLDFHTINRAAVGGSLENVTLARNFQSRSKSRLFLIFGPSGELRNATHPRHL